MPELRLTQYGYNFCVKCSTVGTKRGVPIMKGSGDHTWTETVIMEEDQYEQFVVATALERGDTKTAKAEMLNMEKDDRNLQGPYKIINNIDKDRT
tara:strand:- start:243 stop:527 length:285 start_codon:yes stop_codon:yes gene_type:complete